MPESQLLDLVEYAQKRAELRNSENSFLAILYILEHKCHQTAQIKNAIDDVRATYHSVQSSLRKDLILERPEFLKKMPLENPAQTEH